MEFLIFLLLFVALVLAIGYLISTLQSMIFPPSKKKTTKSSADSSTSSSQKRKQPPRQRLINEVKGFIREKEKEIKYGKIILSDSYIKEEIDYVLHMELEDFSIEIDRVIDDIEFKPNIKEITDMCGGNPGFSTSDFKKIIKYCAEGIIENDGDIDYAKKELFEYIDEFDLDRKELISDKFVEQKTEDIDVFEQLGYLTIAKLRSIARSENIPLKSNLKKAEIVETIYENVNSTDVFIYKYFNFKPDEFTTIEPTAKMENYIKCICTELNRQYQHITSILGDKAPISPP